MARHDLREVVLVEEDLPLEPSDGVVERARDVPSDVPSDGSRTARTVPTATRFGRRRLAVLGVLVALLTTAVVTDGVRERRQEAVLAGVPGLLDPLGPDLLERWRVPSGWGQLATIGGDLVIGRDGDNGVEELVGIDTATGAEQWVTPMPELGDTTQIWCETLGDADRGLTSQVACAVVTRGREGFGRRPPAQAGSGALLVVVDTATGARVAERILDTRYPTLEAVGDDLVVVELPGDGHVRVTRTDPVSGHEQWTFRSAEPVRGAGRFQDTPIPVLHDDVLVVTGTTGWALSLEGDLLGEWDLRGTQLPALLGTPTPDTLTVLPDGRFAAARPGAATRPGRFGTVSAGDDGDGFAIPGPVLEPVVDDGSAEDVLLTGQLAGGPLTAQRATDGQRLWSRAEGVRGDALVLDRRLVTISGDAVTALDVRTGGTLWQVPLGGRRVGLLTDGNVVVAGVLRPEGDRRLVAWGIEDGRERWRAPLPDEVEVLRAIGGNLLAFTEDHVVALG